MVAPNETAAILQTIFHYLPYIIPLILGIGGGYFAAFNQTVPVGRKISHAIKKGNHLQVLEGYDSSGRVVEYSTGLTGYLHEDKTGIDAMPDGRGVIKFYGTTLSWATSHSIANYSAEFEERWREWRNKQEKNELGDLERIAGHKIGTSAQELAAALWDLYQKQKQARAALEEYEKWASNQVTLAELVKQKRFTKEQGVKYEIEMTANARDGGEALRERIKEIDDAGKITV